MKLADCLVYLVIFHTVSVSTLNILQKVTEIVFSLQGIRIILDKLSFTLDTKRVLLNYNLTKLHDGFTLGFNLEFLEKVPSFYVSFTFKTLNIS